MSINWLSSGLFGVLLLFCVEAMTAENSDGRGELTGE